MPPHFLDLSQDHNAKIPWFYCNATVHAPFIVQVDYARMDNPLGGRGGRACYFWFCGWLVLINDKTLWDV